jgi:hypothetical protein
LVLFKAVLQNLDLRLEGVLVEVPEEEPEKEPEEESSESSVGV